MQRLLLRDEFKPPTARQFRLVLNQGFALRRTSSRPHIFRTWFVVWDMSLSVDRATPAPVHNTMFISCWVYGVEMKFSFLKFVYVGGIGRSFGIPARNKHKR